MDFSEAPQRFLNNIEPSRRALALFLLETRKSGHTAQDIASRISQLLQLDPDTDLEDFQVASDLRKQAFSRLFDYETIDKVLALSKAWFAPPEAVISEAINHGRTFAPTLMLSTFRKLLFNIQPPTNIQPCRSGNHPSPLS